MPPRGYQKTQNSHKCQYCTYVTHRRSFMNDHVRVHTGEKPFSCETCAKSFSQKSNLRQHMKVHNQGNNESFKCDLCDFTTKWKSSLQVHDRMHKGEKPYKCKICDRAFSQSTHCQTHMREAHLNMRNFQCDICSKTFKRHEHLERHLAFHKEERNFECDICHKKYLDARYLKQHKLIHDGDASKIHQCPVCSYKSRYSQGLKIHTRIHTGVRPYPCTACTKAFVTSQSLKLHHRMIHQGLAGKIFHCDKCNFSTANNQNLKQHVIKIHVGLKDRRTFKCQFCSSMHNNRSSLNSHMANIHAKQVSRSPVKVIGSLSPAGGAGRNGLVKVRTSPRAITKLQVKVTSQVKTTSPELGQFTSIKVKTEPEVTEVKKELFGEISAEIKIEGNGKESDNAGVNIDFKGKVVKVGKLCNNGTNGSKVTCDVGDDSEGEMVIDMGEEPKVTNKKPKNKMKSKSSSEKKDASSLNTSKAKHAPNVLRIKLSLPKGKNKVKKDAAVNARSKSPAAVNVRPKSPAAVNVRPKSPAAVNARPKSPASSSSGSVSKSPGIDRGIKKSPKKITPSKERARALFVDPDIGTEKRSAESECREPVMPKLQRQTKALDYSTPHIRQVAPTLDYSKPHIVQPVAPPVMSPVRPNQPPDIPSTDNKPPSNHAVVLVTKQYESLRDIATQFLNNNTPPADKVSAPYQGMSHVTCDAYRDENAVTAEIQIKSEPHSDDYLSSLDTAPPAISIQDTALDMRCVKPN